MSAREAPWTAHAREALAAAAAPWGGVIPPALGGRILRDLSMRLGCEPGALCDFARREGFWPHTPKQVCDALRPELPPRFDEEEERED